MQRRPCITWRRGDAADKNSVDFILSTRSFGGKFKKPLRNETCSTGVTGRFLHGCLHATKMNNISSDDKECSPSEMLYREASCVEGWQKDITRLELPGSPPCLCIANLVDEKYPCGRMEEHHSCGLFSDLDHAMQNVNRPPTTARTSHRCLML